MTLIRDIDLTALRTEVLRLAKATPDFVYVPPTVGIGSPSCAYTERTEDGKLVGSCLLGQALVNLGVSPDELRDHENSAISEVLSVVKHPDTLSSEVDWLDHVQELQDTRSTWGHAAGVNSPFEIPVEEFLA